ETRSGLRDMSHADSLSARSLPRHESGIACNLLAGMEAMKITDFGENRRRSHRPHRWHGCETTDPRIGCREFHHGDIERTDRFLGVPECADERPVSWVILALLGEEAKSFHCRRISHRNIQPLFLRKP